MGLSEDTTAAWIPARRRRAVLIADLVESVRLMQLREADTIDRWRRFVAVARDQVVSSYEGRMVRIAGDGLLIEAQTVAGAVAIAFSLHAAIDELNPGRPVDELMQLRVGIHVAEIVVEEHDLQGAGVNLAARLATLGQPGRTLISIAARDEIVDALHAQIVDQGMHYLKGFDDPVRAFAVLPPGQSGYEGAQRPLPSAEDLRPAVAVVPFVAMPADPRHDALGHAIADEVIATLARHPALRVLSRHSTAALRGHVFDLPQLHKAIAVPFLLSGHFYVHEQRVRLNAELCELPSGLVLWAGSTVADIQAFFEGSDELVPHIVANVASQVMAYELTRARSLAMTSLAPYSLYIGATGLMNSLVRDDFDRAHSAFAHLTERYPRQAAPYAMLANWHLFRAMQGWSDDWQADAAHSRDCADRALDIDPKQAAALTARGATLVSFAGDVDSGRACYLAAIESDPTETWAWARLAGALSHVGEHDAACDAAHQALALSPLDPSLFVFESFAAMANLGAGHYVEAVRHARASVRRHALHAPSHRLLTAALWLVDQPDEARIAAKRYLEVQPGATAGIRQRQSVGTPPVWRERFVQALVAAGVPP